MDLTDEQIIQADHQIREAMIAIETALSVHDISIGMALTAMARFIGLSIRQHTHALGQERRQKHVDGFCDIIKSNAFGEDDDEEETT